MSWVFDHFKSEMPEGHVGCKGKIREMMKGEHVSGAFGHEDVLSEACSS